MNENPIHCKELKNQKKILIITSANISIHLSSNQDISLQ